MTVKIATNSTDKINGIIRAISRFFKIEESEINVIHQAVDSGVPDQPFDEQTYVGARNRVDSIIGSNEKEADFYIGCEAGVEKLSGIFFNVQVVCIFDPKSQKYSFGKSSGWSIPLEDIEIIKLIGVDRYLRSLGIDTLEEFVGYSRTEEVMRATEFALASLKL